MTQNFSVGGDVVVISDERLLTIEEILAQRALEIASIRTDDDAKLLRQARALKAARGNRIERDGILYDSLIEMKRHDVLLRWQAAGVISNLAHHPPSIRILDGFDHPSLGHVRARNWELDFVYQQIQEPGLYVWEDFKGRQLPEWKAVLPYRLHALRDRHIFVNDALSGWYTPVK